MKWKGRCMHSYGISFVPYLQATKANRSARFGSSKLVIPIHWSLKSTKHMGRWFLRISSSHQTSLSTWQPHKAWTESSTSSSHHSHSAFLVTFLASKFFLVGNESRQALHRKCLILFGTLRDQILLQQLVWAEVSDGLRVDKSSLDVNILFALLVMYFPDMVPA